MNTIGVLALQGNFGGHCDIVQQLGANAIEVRTAADLQAADALIIPGGESTSISQSIDSAGLFEPIADFAANKSVFGTCAGSILMAHTVADFAFPTFDLLAIEVQRNAYGRQRESAVVTIEFDHQQLDVAFIRAPIIKVIDENIETLATWNGNPVIVCNQSHMAASCHPELLSNTAVHAYFIKRFLHHTTD